LLSQGWSPRCLPEPAHRKDDWAVLKTTAIQDGYFIPEENKKLPPHMVARPELEVRVGDLLLTCAGPRRRCGIVCLVRATRRKLMISGKMYRFRVPENMISPAYIEYFLRHSHTQEAIDKMKTGISDSGLNLTHERFFKLPVIVPPFPEQRRIVAKVDNLSAKSKRSRDQLDHIPRLVEKYKQAILAAAFQGDLTRKWRQRHCPHGQWISCKLADLIYEGPSNGWSPKSGPDATGALTLKLTATTSGYLRLDDAAVKRIYESPPPTSPYWLKPGDVLVQRSNAIEYVGRAAIFEGPSNTYIYPDLMMRIRTKQEIDPQYIWRYLTHSRRGNSCKSVQLALRATCLR
jgi:type I restriction enzyme S subunit